MPFTTPNENLPYPAGTDAPNVQGAFQSLALATDAAIHAISRTPVGAVFAWYDTGGAVPDRMVRCDGSTFSGVTYPALQAHLGSTTTPDLRDKFLRGTSPSGGSYPTNGQSSGWADAVVVGHEHTYSHSHPINHDHPNATTTTDTHGHSINHDHPNTNTDTDSHTHARSLTDFLYRVATSTLTADRYKVPFDNSLGTNFIMVDIGTKSFGTAGDDHSHGLNLPNFSGSSGNDSHAHGLNLPSFSGTTGPLNSSVDAAGQSGLNRNLPPFTNVTWLMQAA